MISNRPSSSRHSARRRSLRSRAIAASLFVAILCGEVRAASTPDSEFLHAIRQSPALTAASRRIEAARARVDAAGLLPDPEVEAMASRMNGPMAQDGTMWELNLRQPLPKRGERAADRERVRAALAMAEAEFAAVAADIAAEIAMSIAEAEGAHARIALLETQLSRLDAVLRTIEIQLSAGTGGRIADRLTVQTRAASMQLMIEEARRAAEDALADARGRLGLEPGSPLPVFAAPAAEQIEAAQSAEARLAAARAAEADAMISMAATAARPMTAVGIRLERQRTSMGNEDTLGVAFMSEIPWRGRRSARAESRAAQAERAAAHTDATVVRFRIESALSRAGRAERLAETARRLGEETRERLDAEYDALVRSAGVGGTAGSTVLQTVEILEKATEAELQVIEAATAARLAQAELWRYAAVSRLAGSTL